MLEVNQLCADETEGTDLLYFKTFDDSPDGSFNYGEDDLDEDIASLNKLLDWWTKTPYDHYNEWLSETYDSLKRSDKA